MGGVTHSKVSGIANPGDPTLVGGADWDAAHTISLATGARYPVQSKVGTSSSSNTRAITVTAPVNGNTLILFTLSESTFSVSSVVETNVSWSKIAGTSAGVAPVIECWKGVVSASAGTTITITFSGTGFCNGSVTEWASLAGTLEASATRASTADATGIHPVAILAGSSLTSLVMTAVSTTSNSTLFTVFAGSPMVLSLTSTLGVYYGFPAFVPVYGAATGGNSATASSLTVSLI